MVSVVMVVPVVAVVMAERMLVGPGLMVVPVVSVVMPVRVGRPVPVSVRWRAAPGLVALAG